MTFKIGKNCQIDPSAVINVNHGFIGEGSIINAGARIEGERVEIGREAFIDRYATIGGGSCFDPGAHLKAGDWFHMGVSSQVNTARGVRVGHEFGCGIETKIFTHGAYLDAYNLGAPVQWAPVEIGDSVWLPNAWVNPGVCIGNHVVVAARSLVNCNLPSGCLAGGVPVKILKSDWLPRPVDLKASEHLISEMVNTAWQRYHKSLQVPSPAPVTFDGPRLITEEGGKETIFELNKKTIEGPATVWTLLLKDQLRRNGIRFRFEAHSGFFRPWL